MNQFRGLAGILALALAGCGKGAESLTPPNYGIFILNDGKYLELSPSGPLQELGSEGKLLYFDKSVATSAGEWKFVQADFAFRSGIWKPKETAIEGKIQPVEGKPEMIRILPATTLKAGVYYLLGSPVPNKPYRFVFGRDKLIKQHLEMARKAADKLNGSSEAVLISSRTALSIGAEGADAGELKGLEDKAKTLLCGENLRRLWSLALTYQSQFGGRMKAMSKETGERFWLALTETTPPLIESQEASIFSCPWAKERRSPGETDYSGPPLGISRLAGGDIVGGCTSGAHPDGATFVLYKSGDVRVIPGKGPSAPMALRAREVSPVVQALRNIATAEADFRANDRDGNKLQDFWTGDVSGLYRYLRAGEPVKLIQREVAEADAIPIHPPSLAKHAAQKPVPFSGYLFVALKGWRDQGAGAVKVYGVDTDRSGSPVRNESSFGFAAVPAEYGKSGTLTVIISEQNTTFLKDTGGKIPDEYPADPEGLGWVKAD